MDGIYAIDTCTFIQVRSGVCNPTSFVKSLTPNDVIKDGTKDNNDPKDDPKELSERQKLILHLIRENDFITIQQMTQKV